MFELIKLLFDICLLNKGPQDIPPSSWLLNGLILAYALIGFLVLYIGTPWYDAALQVLVEIALVILFTKVLLGLTRKPERYLQTASALFGTDVLISFFALPAMTSMTTGKMTLLTFSVMLGLMIWHWLVTGHIIRHAISQSLSFGLGIAFLYILATYRIMALLFPQAVAN
ncbi:MAG: hypothetical protein ACU83N_04460 [Gammaproteobacteria bacterium]